MTFKRFKQIWDCLITDAPKRPITSDTLVMEGSSQHTLDALVKVAHGDHSAFDEVARVLAARDRA